MTEQQREGCPPRSSLLGFSAGTLEEADADCLSEHLMHCETCVETIDSMRDTSDTVAVALRRVDVGNEYLDEPELIQGLEELGSLRAVMDTVVAGNDDTDDISPDPAAATVVGGEPDSRDSVSSHLLDRPETLGNYRLISKLGQGGMGAVYKAVHSSLDKTVAVKVLSVARFGNRNATERFTREMKAMGRVQHPNVVIAHDGGDIDGEHFLVMEYVDGLDISALDQRHQGLPVSVACEIVRQAAIGLQHAHDVGLIHRDIKPSNLMLDQSGIVKVLDLGLARISSDLSGINEASGNEDATQSELTNQGTAIGTMGYMAPEQALDSRSVDARADLYSLGATLYKLLAGTLPFPSEHYDTNGKMLVAIATKTPASIATLRSDLPAELIKLVDRTLAKNPADRVTAAGEFAELLTPFAGASLVGLASLPKGQLPDIVAAETPTAATQRTKPKRWPLVATGLLLAAMLFFAAVQSFWIQTEYGTLLVEIADERVEAKLKEAGISIVDETNNRVWDIQARPIEPKSLPEGKYRFEAPRELLITDDNGLEIKASELKLVDASQQLRIRVSLVADSDVKPSRRNSTESDSSVDSLRQREVDAAKWVESVGGTMQRGGPGSGKVTSLDVEQTPGLVWTVDLNGRGNLGDGPQKLKHFPNLRVLFVDDTSYNIENLRSILTNQQIYWLSVKNTQLTSRDFRLLTAFPRLNSLGVSWSQVDDEWEFMKQLDWLPEINLSTSEWPQLDQLARYQQLDTIWVYVDHGKSSMSASLFEERAILASQQNTKLRLAIGGRVVGSDPVLITAQKLDKQGWTLSGMYSDWRREWNTNLPDPWQDEDWFHVRHIQAPDKFQCNVEALDQLAALGHAFDSIRFPGATDVQLLPEYLRSRWTRTLDLNGAKLDDKTLARIADISGIERLEIAGTQVTAEGVARFKQRWPNCEIVGGPKTTIVEKGSDTLAPFSFALNAGRVYPIAEMVGEVYEFEFMAMRMSDKPEAMIIHIQVDGRPASVLLGGWGGKWSGLQRIDNLWAEPPNKTAIPLDPFADHAPHHVRVRVTKQSVETWVDQQPIIAWSGDAKQLSFVPPGSGQGGIENVPLSLYAFPPADFQVWNLQFATGIKNGLRTSLDTEQEIKNLSSTVLKPDERVVVASETPKEYQVEFSVKRQSGNEGALLVHIPVADKRAIIVLAGYEKARSGLSMIDGAEPFDNETTRMSDPFIDGRVHRVLVRVTDDSIFASVDDFTWLDWKVEPSRLSAPGWSAETGLVIHSGQETRFEVSDLRLKDLTSGGEPISGWTDADSPQDLATDEGILALVESVGGSIHQYRPGGETRLGVADNASLSAHRINLNFDGRDRFDDAALIRLAGLLEKRPDIFVVCFHMNTTPVTNAGLRSLKRIPIIQIDVGNTGVIGDAIASQLSEFSIAEWSLVPGMTEAGYLEFLLDARLEVLNMTGELLTAPVIDAINQSDVLSIRLRGSDSSPLPGLDVMKRLTNLERLNLFSDKTIPLQVAAELHKANPHMEIAYRNKTVFKADLAAKRRWLSRGQWTRPEIEMPIADEVADRYVLEFDAQRLDEPSALRIRAGGLQIRFPIADSAADLHLSGWMHHSNGLNGLGRVNGIDVPASPDHIEADPFADGRDHRIRVEVTPSSVVMSVDDTVYVNWQGDASTLTSSRTNNLPAELYLKIYARFRISNLEFTEEREQ